jgi:hypothetical protein
VKNAIKVFFKIVSRANKTRILAIPNLYLTHFIKELSFLRFSIGRQNSYVFTAQEVAGLIAQSTAH